MLNIVLAVVLVGRYGILGLGLALRHRLRRRARCGRSRCCRTRCPGFPLRAVLASLWRMLVAAALAGEATWLVGRRGSAATGRRRRAAGVRVAVGWRSSRRAAALRRPSLRRLLAGARELAAPVADRRAARRSPVTSRRCRRPVGSPPCSSSLKKWWKYLTAKLTGSFNERADPKVQLEQAIAEAQNQHRRLKEQAANVIANQKQSEIRLNAQDDASWRSSTPTPARR